MKSLAVTSALLLLLSACHTKKTVATAERVETNTACVSACSTETAMAGSLLRFLSAELDSAEIIIEPVGCDDVYRQDFSDTLHTPSTPRKSRLRVRAKHIRLDDKMNAEIVSASQTLQTDSLSHHGQSVAETVEASDKVVGYNPPNLVWLFGLALVLLAAAFALVWYFKK